jgi:lipopolysaccharide heptosyltransferase I
VKILLVRLGSLGDLVHTLPVAAALRQADPHHRIDWLVDRRHRELLDLSPVIDSRIAVDTRSLGSLIRVIPNLRRQQYDVAFDLQGLIKSALLARASGACRVVGFPTPLLRERAASVFYTETAGVDAAHIIQKNLSMLRALGIGHVRAEFPLTNGKPDVVAAARAQLGIKDDEPFAIINPSGGWPNKRWPAVFFAEVASMLKVRHGLSSIVLWGPGERQLAEDVVGAARGSAAVSPQTGMAELISLTSAAAVMVSGDTGPTHIAAAVGTPLVGIYGPTDPDRNGPWVSRDLTVSRFDVCQCHYERRCHAKRWCLLDLLPKEVMDRVDERLADTIMKTRG